VPQAASTSATQVDPCAITPARLSRLVPGIDAKLAATYAAALEFARSAGDLTTPGRVRHFMAQCAHETGGFVRLVESMAYRDPDRLDRYFSAVKGRRDALALIAKGPEAIADRVYANRLGNRGESSGDGWRYRGRGFLQITGYDNYRLVGNIIGMDLRNRPELLADPAFAAGAAAIYWRERGLNACADADDVRAVTAGINPALAGLDDRIAWLGRARRVWP
jgi:putative chitinase